MEYALKYGDNLKGLVVSNMMASIPKYNEYAQTTNGSHMSMYDDPQTYFTGLVDFIRSIEVGG